MIRNDYVYLKTVFQREFHPVQQNVHMYFLIVSRNWHATIVSVFYEIRHQMRLDSYIQNVSLTTLLKKKASKYHMWA